MDYFVAWGTNRVDEQMCYLPLPSVFVVKLDMPQQCRVVPVGEYDERHAGVDCFLQCRHFFREVLIFRVH